MPGNVAVRQQSRPDSRLKPSVLSGERRFGYEAVWLPLAGDGEHIDMLMAGLVYRDSRDAGPLDWQPHSAA